MISFSLNYSKKEFKEHNLMDEIKVNYQIWKDKFEEIFKTYEVIDSYLRNNDAIHLHLKSLQKDIRIQQNSPNDPYLKTQSILPAIELIAKLVEIDKEKKQLEPLIKKADDMYHEGVQYEKYNFIVEFSSQFVKQIIVMMYSHLYDCLKDYFKYLLKENPKILIGLINTGTEKKGLIPFSKVLEAENLTTIIDEQINVSSAQLVEAMSH